MATKKFRPYFSPDELKILISALNEKPTPERLSLSKYLQHYCLKIDGGFFTPAITLKPSLEEQLEFTQEPSEDSPNRLSSLRLQSFLKWSKNPASCTPIELHRANEYRFGNDLMSQEEEAQYVEQFGA